ncbi:hypothetical protein [Ideonella sp. A 288]|uniref:hypothetical protein n=1 Tax=Ideonella sp. A 288 TaxID=1962181 RepID=UPI0018FEA2BD|nr:hypothetical protein [Ideonella sp. A 288]
MNAPVAVRIIAAVACAIALAVTPPVARAGETQDQANEPAWTGGAVNVTPGNKVGQTVVPKLPLLTGVSLALKTGNRGRGGDKLTLSVMTASGQALATVGVTIQEGTEDWVRFSMPGAGLAVTPQQPLTLRLQDTGKNVFWWKYKGGNTYPAGGTTFGGKPFSDNDFLFRTYGTSVAPSFTLSVSPDPARLTAGQSRDVTVGVGRLGGFNGSVSVTFFGLPQGVTSSKVPLVIGGASGTTTLKAATTATVGRATVDARGTSGALGAHKNFTFEVAAAPPTCRSGQTACGNRCVDTQTDNAHCGSCGHACSAGAQCSAGACATPAAKCGTQTCAASQWCCQKACRNSVDGGSCPYQGSSAEYYCPKGTHACYDNPAKPSTPSMNCCCSDTSGALGQCPGPGR